MYCIYYNSRTHTHTPGPGSRDSAVGGSKSYCSHAQTTSLVCGTVRSAEQRTRREGLALAVKRESLHTADPEPQRRTRPPWDPLPGPGEAFGASIGVATCVKYVRADRAIHNAGVSQANKKDVVTGVVYTAGAGEAFPPESIGGVWCMGRDTSGLKPKADERTTMSSSRMSSITESAGASRSRCAALAARCVAVLLAVPSHRSKTCLSDQHADKP